MNKWLDRLYLSSPAALQNLMVTAYGVESRLQRFGKRYEHWVEFLERSERFSEEELQAYQDERVADLIRHAYERVPYYRRVMDERRLTPQDIRTVAHLAKLPILTKDLVRKHLREMIAEGESLERLKASPTSGTTGSPFVVYWDRETDVLWNVMIWRHRRWAGIRFGERYGTFLGRVVVPTGVDRRPFWRYNLAWNQIVFSSFHLSPKHFGAYIDTLQRSGIVAIEAYPSTAYILALGLESAGVRVPLRAVFTSSEPLLQVQRELIEDRFQTSVYDYYGMSESIMFAGECPAHCGMHHHAEMSVVEVMDANGDLVPDGQVGRLIGTTLHNRAMPLIRYDVGDLTSRLGKACECGRAHPLFSQVTTKAEDIVVTPDGRLVSPSVLTHPFKLLRGLVKSQIIQESIDHVRILLVPAEAPNQEVLEELRAAFEARLGSGVRIEIEIVEDIKPGPTGKFRWVVSKLPLEWKLKGRSNLYTALAETAHDELGGLRKR